MVVLPVLEPAGVRAQLVPIDRHEVGAVMVGLRRDAPGRGSSRGRRGTRCPRGPRRYLRPVADRKSQPIVCRRRCRAGRPTGRRRRRYGTPAARVSAPISAAGLTRPPLVGTWVSDTERDVAADSARRPSRRPTPARTRRSAPARRRRPYVLGGPEEGDRVRAVLVVVDEDALSLRHRHRPERRVPGRGRMLEPGDLVRRGRRCRRPIEA